jgi:hypothetical protein
MIAQPAHKLERGQALPLLALALIALAGFAALALDGGNLWTEQRRAQAAADNAVMAAAYQEMNGFTGSNLSNAAFANAAQNGYVTGPHTTVVFHLPPIHGAYAGNSQYMEVVITQTVPTALAHLVYQQDPIPVTVIAVAHGTPTGPLMDGYALAAMYPTCGGNSTIYVQARGGGQTGGTFLYDAGAFVNSPCTNPVALDASGNHDGIVTNGPPISVVGGANGSTCTPAEALDPSSNCNWYPAPTTGVAPVTQDPLQGTPAATLPQCGPVRDLAAQLSAGPNIISGTYTTLDSGNQDMNLLPGIYCLKGGKMSSGNGTTTGHGVLLYLTDDPASPNTVPWIDYSGNGNVDLSAAQAGDANGCTGNADPSHEICKYLGFLIYKVTGANTCDQNDVEVDFTGGTSMNILGLVYAPYSLVRYGGNGSLTMTGQTIAGCVKFNGNGNINIIYNPNVTYSPPPSVRLDQ